MKQALSARDACRLRRAAAITRAAIYFRHCHDILPFAAATPLPMILRYALLMPLR